METIEERAKEFAKGRRYTLTAYEGYSAGATEQKAIDDAECVNQVLMGNRSAINYYQQGYHDAIENACEWLKERVQCGVHPQRAYGFAEEFRKAMEEKL